MNIDSKFVLNLIHMTLDNLNIQELNYDMVIKLIEWYGFLLKEESKSDFAQSFTDQPVVNKSELGIVQIRLEESCAENAKLHDKLKRFQEQNESLDDRLIKLDAENRVLWRTLDNIRDKCIPIQSEAVNPYDALREIRDLTRPSKIEELESDIVQSYTDQQVADKKICKQSEDEKLREQITNLKSKNESLDDRLIKLDAEKSRLWEVIHKISELTHSKGKISTPEALNRIAILIRDL